MSTPSSGSENGTSTKVSVPAVKTKHVEDGCGAPPAAKERNKYKVAAIPSSTTSKNSKVAVVETLNVA